MQVLFTPVFAIPNAKRDSVLDRLADRELLDERAWIEMFRKTIPITEPLGHFLYHELQAMSRLPSGLIRPGDLLVEDLHFWSLCYFDAEFDLVEDLAYELQVPTPPLSILYDVRTVADLARNCMSYICEEEQGQR